MRKSFEHEFFPVLKKDISFAGVPGTRMCGILRIAGSCGPNDQSRLNFHDLILEIRWPITITLSVDLAIYPEKTELSRHIDLYPKEKGSEYRLVVVLKKAKQGGHLLCDRFIINFWRIKLFSTRIPHQVTRIEQGKRIALLFGIRIGPRTK
jgi:hypothetical protein